MALKLALRYLKGRMVRTILTTLSIVFGVMIMFGLNGLIPALSVAFEESMSESVHKVDILLTHELGLVFDEEKLEILRRDDDIKIVSPVLERTLSLGDAHELRTLDGDVINKIVVNGWDIETSKEALPLNLDAGRWLEETDRSQNVILVRQSFLDKIQLSLNDSIDLPTAKGVMTFRIIGVLPPAPVLGKEEVYMSLEKAQEVFNMNGKVSAVIAQFKDHVTDKDLKRQALKAEFGEGYAFGSIDAGENEWAALMDMGNMIFTIFGLVALALGGFIMYNTFKVSVKERAKDIGMLRTLGARKVDVMKMVVAEGLIVGFAGTLIGIGMGYLLLMISIPLIRPIWQELFNVSIGMPFFSPIIFAISIVFGMGVPVVSVIIPAKKASEVDPMVAIRPSLSTGKTMKMGYASGIGFILLIVSLASIFVDTEFVMFAGSLAFFMAVILLTPVIIKPLTSLFSIPLSSKVGKMAVLNTLRESKRTSSTAVTMLVSIALLVAVSGMASTFTDGLMGYMEKSMSSDYLILQDAMILGSEGSVGAGNELVEEISRVRGVENLTALRQSNAKAGDTPLSIIGIDVTSYRELSGLTFISDNEDQAYEMLGQGKNIIINGALAVQGGYDLGDLIVLRTVHGDRAYKVVGIGIDYLNSKSATAYISHENIEEDYNVYNNALIMVNRQDGADKKAVEDELLTLIEDYSTFSVLSYEVWLDFQEDGNRTRNMFMYILTAILAVPSLIALMNTLSMSVIERTREIGMLRAVGMTVKQVRKMILTESLLIAFMGVLLGGLTGVWMGYGFVQIMNVSGFILEYVFPFSGILVAGLVGIIFGSLAAVSPIKRATKFDIVDAIKYE